MFQIDIKLVKSNIVSERRLCVEYIFDKYRSILGVEKEKIGSHMGIEYAQGTNTLFSEYRVSKSGLEREFSLRNAAETKIFPEPIPYVFPDKEEDCGGYFHKTGDHEDVIQLRVFASWHENSIRRSLELYKLWLFEWISDEEMEKILVKMDENHT